MASPRCVIPLSVEAPSREMKKWQSGLTGRLGFEEGGVGEQLNLERVLKGSTESDPGGKT